MAYITFRDDAVRSQSWQARQRHQARDDRASRGEFLLTWLAVLTFCIGTWSLALGALV